VDLQSLSSLGKGPKSSLSDSVPLALSFFNPRRRHSREDRANSRPFIRLAGLRGRNVTGVGNAVLRTIATQVCNRDTLVGKRIRSLSRGNSSP
jgi:hypothetical protein